jgi:hypothetical protein
VLVAWPPAAVAVAALSRRKAGGRCASCPPPLVHVVPAADAVELVRAVRPVAAVDQALRCVGVGYFLGVDDVGVLQLSYRRE